ncbi:hypothetical protein BFF78_37260 [Streptomyces fodineus]|uniref:Uncharacterized protein n=1 Tax=Streptomyces fodineus TaxID=1904616 RepID=A0A1D7YK33_9ACTN|nr:hypothetical protein BFF78_37260 [Streptomyces fodineus]
MPGIDDDLDDVVVQDGTGVVQLRVRVHRQGSGCQVLHGIGNGVDRGGGDERLVALDVDVRVGGQAFRALRDAVCAGEVFPGPHALDAQAVAYLLDALVIGGDHMIAASIAGERTRSPPRCNRFCVSWCSASR